MVITVLKIPAFRLHLKANNADGFYVRKDKPYYIDLNIGIDSLVDRMSGIDLSQYVIEKINY